MKSKEVVEYLVKLLSISDCDPQISSEEFLTEENLML